MLLACINEFDMALLVVEISDWLASFVKSIIAEFTEKRRGKNQRAKGIQEHFKYTREELHGSCLSYSCTAS